MTYMEMYSSGRKRAHSKCVRSARAQGFDSLHLRVKTGERIRPPVLCFGVISECPGWEPDSGQRDDKLSFLASLGEKQIRREP